MEPDILAPPASLPMSSSVANPSTEVEGSPAANGLAPTLNGHGANGHGTNGHAHPSRTPRLVGAPAGAAAHLTDLSAYFTESSQESVYLTHGKRVLDIVGASLGLLVSAPLFALCALLVKLESRGPVLFRQRRVGWRGRAFTFYKLRSMRVGAHEERRHLLHMNEADGPVFKLSRDPRVTRIGRWLRTTSLDEIPQFINVLRGEMSLVGPRPPLPEEVAHYEAWQIGRLAVRPGMTCLWQISGRSTFGFQEWMRLDLEYIKQQSFWLDLKILLRTLPAVVSREGAY